MPVHLAPLSRRSFFRRAASASAALFSGRRLLAGAGFVDRDCWALLADTHIAADLALKERGVQMAGHFRTVAKELLVLRQMPAGLILAGDCASNTGEAGDYHQLLQLLQPIREAGLPVHLTLGNHDHRQRFQTALPAFSTHPDVLLDRQAELISTPRLNWLLLDSLEATNSTPGMLGPQQLAWLTAVLDAAPAKPAIIVVHHNPGIDTSASFKIAGLRDTEALLEVIRPRRQLKACIYGHTHHWKFSTDPDGIHWINLPPVAYVFRPGSPSGWVRADLGPNGMQLELRCIDISHPAHGQKTNFIWRV